VTLWDDGLGPISLCCCNNKPLHLKIMDCATNCAIRVMKYTECAHERKCFQLAATLSTKCLRSLQQSNNLFVCSKPTIRSALQELPTSNPHHTRS